MRAEQAAQELLKKYNVNSVPVDVIELARKEGISVIVRSLENDISALLVVKSGRAAIGVNQEHHPNRQRFSIAHELGHYYLHSQTSSVFVDSTLTFHRDTSSSEGTYHQEIQANAFAAELLMPEKIVWEYLTKHLVDLYDHSAVVNLAQKFGVSEQALTIRLVNLGILSA